MEKNRGIDVKEFTRGSVPELAKRSKNHQNGWSGGNNQPLLLPVNTDNNKPDNTEILPNSEMVQLRY